MPSFGLDNLNSYPPVGQTPSATAASSFDSSFGGFDDALQRAGQSNNDSRVSDSWSTSDESTAKRSNSPSTSTSDGSASTDAPSDATPLSNSADRESTSSTSGDSQAASDATKSSASQDASTPRSENGGKAPDNSTSTELAQGGKLSRWAIHRRQSAQAAAVADESATNASSNATQAPTADLLSGSPQSIANARATAARLKVAASTAKAPTAGKTERAAAANVALDQTTDPNQTIVGPAAAATPATDVGATASSIVLATATSVPAVLASTGGKPRGAAASSVRGGNIAGGAAVSDAANQVQTAESADATLQADSASSSLVPIQTSGPARSSGANSRAGNPANSAENSAAIVADSIAAEIVGAAAAATAQPAVSGSSSDSADSTDKPATAPVASTAATTPTAGANTANVALNNQVNVGVAAQASNAAGTSSSGGTSGTSEVDRVRFVQRVARAFQAADEDGGQIRLRLSPPELGSMKIEITMHGGTMTAHVETETAAARNMLLDNLPALRQRLADQNIKVEQFDVDLRDQSGGGAPSGSGFADPRNQMPQYAPRTIAATVTNPIATTSIPTSSLLGGSGQLNVVV